MIIRCPSCATRIDVPSSHLDADGIMIKCSVCGHGWLEGHAVEIHHDPIQTLPAIAENRFEASSEIRRLVDATHNAQEQFEARRRKRRAALAAWLAFAAAVASPPALAFALPELTVKIAPASIVLYDWLGRDVNIYGLDIRNVDMQHLQTDGTRVLSIKGEIANTSLDVRKIPWLRFGLKDQASAEIYTWQLNTNARPLNPGESTSFVTRIASPPESAREVEIRFARLNEISSND
jgi:predicted Zn finger-like uncharacterized protein